MEQEIYMLLFIIGLIVFIVLWIKKSGERSIEENSRRETNSYNYNKSRYVAKPLLTKTEIQYYNAIKHVLGNYNRKYYLKEQITLASIIKKEPETKYANELFKILDFGIFDENYNIIVAIEINDSTHYRQDRIERDKKVKAILDQARIPLITLWTDYNINYDYIYNRLNDFLYN